MVQIPCFPPTWKDLSFVEFQGLQPLIPPQYVNRLDLRFVLSTEQGNLVMLI